MVEGTIKNPVGGTPAKIRVCRPPPGITVDALVLRRAVVLAPIRILLDFLAADQFRKFVQFPVEGESPAPDRTQDQQNQEGRQKLE